MAKRPLVGSTRRGEDNIKIDIQEVGWGGMIWMWLRIGTHGGLL